MLEPEYRTSSVQLLALSGFPDVKPGDDLAEILLERLSANGIAIEIGDIIALAHKIVSKAEDRFVNLASVVPDKESQEIAAVTKKDPRLVHLILSESSAISRMREGVLIVRHRLGFTSANAGIDRSNVPQDLDKYSAIDGQGDTPGEWVLLLPEDPDGSAANLGQTIKARTGVMAGIIIVDSHGRPFRLGTAGVAVGVYGIPALWNRRGEEDRYGYELQHTEVGVADEIAAAASLLLGQAGEGQPAILIRGLRLPDQMGRASELIRPREMDLYG